MIRTVRRAVLMVALVALAAALSAWALWPAGSAAGFTLDEQPRTTVELYRFVAGHQELAERVTCYCGCGPQSGHRFLRDCFVLDSGDFEAHASGCGVCLAEAGEVRRRHDAGEPVEAIAAAIDESFSGYGPPTDSGGAR